MIERIGSLRPSRFAISHLTSGFFQMPLNKMSPFYFIHNVQGNLRMEPGFTWDCRLQLILSRKLWGPCLIYSVSYNICEVYIDDMLVFGDNDDAFIRNVRKVFQKNVALNTKNSHWV